MFTAFNYNEPAVTIKDFVEIPLFLISLTGVPLFKWTPDEPLTRRIIILFCTFCILVTFNLFCLFCFLIHGHLETALDYTELIIYWGFALNSMMKGGTLLVGRGELEFIIKGLMARHPQTPKECEAYRLIPYYKKITAYNKYLTLWHLGTTTMFNLHPMASSIFEYLRREDETQEYDYKFPFNMYYYYNEEQPISYAITYLTQCFGSYYMSYMFLGGDLFLITLVHLVNMHFEYLGRHIEAFEPSGTDEDLKVIEPLMAYHNEILDYAKRIDATFCLSILLNYIGSCVVLCLIGVQLVIGTEFVSLVKFMAFLIATMVHVYFISYFGNNLIELSFGISHAFYNHPWHKANYKYMRMLVIPIARAQRYAHLTAFQYFEISMNSFKSLCTTSYQLFTLLRTSLEEDKG